MKKMAWSTQDELSFVVGLGSFADPQRCKNWHGPMPERAEILRRYLEGARLRRDWDDLDRPRILDHALRELAQAEAHERAG